jgi:hypothetical protein
LLTHGRPPWRTAQGTGITGVLNRAPETKICLREWSWPLVKPAPPWRAWLLRRKAWLPESGSLNFRPVPAIRTFDPTAVCFLFDTAFPRESKLGGGTVEPVRASSGFQKKA